MTNRLTKHLPAQLRPYLREIICIPLLLLSLGCLFYCFKTLYVHELRKAEGAINSLMQSDLDSFAGELRALAQSSTASTARPSSDTLSTLYDKCNYFEVQRKSPLGEVLYPAYKAQLGQIQTMCEGLARVERKGGITATHLELVAQEYGRQLKNTSERAAVERAAFVSEQIKSLAE